MEWGEGRGGWDWVWWCGVGWGIWWCGVGLGESVG